jgi:hypothetical protein
VRVPTARWGRVARGGGLQNSRKSQASTHLPRAGELRMRRAGSDVYLPAKAQKDKNAPFLQDKSRMAPPAAWGGIAAPSWGARLAISLESQSWDLCLGLKTCFYLFLDFFLVLRINPGPS